MRKFRGSKQDNRMLSDRKHEQRNPVEVKPVKTAEGNFFVVYLRSLHNPSVLSTTSFPVSGNETRLEERIKVCVGALCEYQQAVYGDSHRVSERQADGVEAFRKCLRDFRAMMEGKANG